MIEPSEYRITVQRRETEDGVLFEGTVHELPDVAVYSETFNEAYDLVVDAIEGLYELAEQQGRPFPGPSHRDTEYSGKFVVRVPRWLHRSLALSATEQVTSLNQHVLSILSSHEARGNVAIQYAANVPEVAPAATVVASGSPIIFYDVGGYMKSLEDSAEFTRTMAIGHEADVPGWQIFSLTKRVSDAA